MIVKRMMLVAIYLLSWQRTVTVWQISPSVEFEEGGHSSMPDSVPAHVRLSSIRVGTIPWPKLRYAVGSIFIEQCNNVIFKKL